MVPGTPFTPREDMRILPTGVCLAVGANFLYTTDMGRQLSSKESSNASPGVAKRYR